jgi:nucleoside-diphosphate-sugar epimerase
MFSGKTVLVTGGTGFIGGRLVEKLVLEHRARVRVLVRNFARAARIARLPIEMLPGDLADPAAVRAAARGCELVFHCAYDFAGTKDQQRRVAIESTRNVGEAALEFGLARMVHVSSFAIYAPMQNGDLTEDSPWPNCKDSYVLAKREAERLFRQLHRTQRLPVVIVQPTLVYGPFSPHWTLAPIQKLTTGLVPLLNHGDGYCNAVYIDDVVDAMILAAIRPGIDGETFLISGEKPITWKDFYRGFENRLGIHGTVEVVEEELINRMKARRRQRGTLPQLLNLVRHPEVATGLISLPPVRATLKVFKNCLPDDRWQTLKSFLLASPSENHVLNGSGKVLHIPDEMLLGLYRTKTRVRIEKARKLLGYVPKFDFERGMDLTAHFIHWANLVSDAPGFRYSLE